MTEAEYQAVRNGPWIEHVTSEGERWDQLANRYYGDPYRYEPIVAANPAIGILPIFEGGLTLLVPVLPTPDVASNDDLPPWKQGA